MPSFGSVIFPRVMFRDTRYIEARASQLTLRKDGEVMGLTQEQIEERKAAEAAKAAEEQVDQAEAETTEDAE